MTEPLLDAVSWILAGIGCFFLLVGGVGILRLPGFFARLHAASLIDTLGVLASLAALAIQMDAIQGTLKVLLILLFLVITLPATTHALAKSARRHGRKESR